jgi:hypothetical protein
MPSTRAGPTWKKRTARIPSKPVSVTGVVVDTSSTAYSGGFIPKFFSPSHRGTVSAKGYRKRLHSFPIDGYKQQKTYKPIANRMRTG